MIEKNQKKDEVLLVRVYILFLIIVIDAHDKKQAKVVNYCGCIRTKR